MGRTRVRWARVAVVATVLAATVWAAGGALGSHRADSGAARRHVVGQGETLWEIARALVGPEGDPRPAVQAIREANGLGTRPLVAGDSLMIPSA